VDTLSGKSRRRLMALLSRVKSDAPFHFMTLTYPGNFERWKGPYFPADEVGPPIPLPGPRQSKEDLDTFLKFVYRLCPGASAFWKLEPQKRGVPHFHLIWYGLPVELGGFPIGDILRDKWHSIAGRGDPLHLRFGFDMPPPDDNAERARWYVAKYASKDGPQPLNADYGRFSGFSPGRFWGIHNRASAPFVTPWTLTVCGPENTAVALRILRNLQRSNYRESYRKRCDAWFSGGQFREHVRPSLTAHISGVPVGSRIGKWCRGISSPVKPPRWRSPFSGRLNSYFLRNPDRIGAQISAFLCGSSAPNSFSHAETCHDVPPLSHARLAVVPDG
jgi:hypothetical protein